MTRLITLFFLATSFSAWAQEPPKNEVDLEHIIQKLLPVGSSTDDLSDTYDNLIQYFQQPLDINKASLEQLQVLHILTDAQAAAIIKHRTVYGDFISLYELQSIDELPIETIRNLVPFVEVSQTFKVGDLSDGNMLWLVRMDQTLEPQKGYTDPEIKAGVPTARYEGSKQRVLSRFKMYSAKDFSFGATVEKDAGEKGPDFFSFHAHLQNRGKWKNITVGDFQVQMGQGLVSSAGFTGGKGSETILSIRRGATGTRPYTSSIEGGFFRGATATYVLPKAEITVLASNNANDATLLEDELDAKFASISNTGFHRTFSESARKDLLKEKNVGLNAIYKTKNGSVGLSGLHTSFNAPLDRAENYYNQFEFQGDKNTLLGVNFNQYISNLNIFGEAARSSSGGIGAMMGLIKPVSKRLDFSLLFRNYDKDFHTFYGNAFGENSRNINERGLYFGTKYTIYRKLIVSGFADFYRFPNPKYLVAEPSQGNDLMAKIQYFPQRTRELSFQVFHENKQKNLPGVKPATMVGTERSLMLLNYDHQWNKHLNTQTRVQRNTFAYQNQGTSIGYLAFQDVSYKTFSYSISGRLAYFDVDSYDARIYAYEKDILYAFSFPAYYRKGLRAFAVLSKALSKTSVLNVRLARTELLDGSSSIGSGLDEISFPHKTDLKVQLVWRM